MRLSLIICTYRRPLPTRRLLDALGEQTAPPDEVLVVDGSPDDETAAVVQATLQQGSVLGLHYHKVPPEHRGLTRQRNYGIARAAGDIVAFLDDDTVPEREYFQEIRACFDHHPDAAGVGGYITGLVWKRVDPNSRPGLGVFRWGEWERRDDYRWRLRKLFRLASPYGPGWMPPSGHGRSASFPPDGKDYHVEFIMGGASAWRRSVFERHQFSRYFEGYGLYEDLDFCIRAGQDGPLYVCTRARLAHYHAPDGRPNQFRYGQMVVRNGWFVWRRRWPHPSYADRLRWWAVTLLLALCRVGDGFRGPDRLAALSEASGRVWGMLGLLRPPGDTYA